MSDFWAAKLKGQTPTAPAIIPRDMYTRTTVSSPSPSQSYSPSSSLITSGSSCERCGGPIPTVTTREGSPAVTCFSCGFNPLATQQGSGVPSVKTPGVAVTPARQTGQSSSLQDSINNLNRGLGDHILSL